jgi:hypothetical protein
MLPRPARRLVLPWGPYSADEPAVLYMDMPDTAVSFRDMPLTDPLVWLNMLQQLCGLVHIMALAQTPHGLLHLSNIYHDGPSGKNYVIGFSDGDSDSYCNAASDHEACARILQAYELQTGMWLHGAVDAMRTAHPVEADRLLAQTAMKLTSFGMQCVARLQSDMPQKLLAHNKLLQIPVSCTDESITSIVLMINGIVTTAEPVLPLFKHAESCATGLGPTTGIIQWFFAEMRRRGVLAPEPNGEAQHVWPQKPDLWRADGAGALCLDRKLYRTIGYLFCYSVCMNISPGVFFSPVLLRMLLLSAETTEFERMAQLLPPHTARDLLAQMHYGALPLVRMLQANQWSAEHVCSLYARQPYHQQQQHRLPRIVYDNDSLTTRQQQLVAAWLKQQAESRPEMVRRFLILVANSPRLNPEVDCIRIGGTENSVTRICTCDKSILIPRAALVSDETCRAYFEAQLADGGCDFNCL